MATMIYNSPMNHMLPFPQQSFPQRMPMVGVHSQRMHNPPHIIVGSGNHQHFAPLKHARAPAQQADQARRQRPHSAQPSIKPNVTMRIKTQAADPSRGKGKRILCYGDSLTAGLLGNWCAKFEPYAKRLSQHLQSRVDHVGLCGWDTKQMVEAIDSSSSVDVKRVNWEPAGLRLALQRAKEENDPYEIVIIMAGTNGLQTMPSSTNVDNLVALHTCAAQFGAKVVSVAVPRHKELLHQPKRQFTALKQAWEEMNHKLEAAVKAQQDKGVDILFLDVHTRALSKAGPDAAVLFSSDGLHFSVAGSHAFADTLHDMGRTMSLWK